MMRKITAMLCAFCLLAVSSGMWAEPLRNGSEGEQVMRLQQRLIDSGFLNGTADGKFGKNTAAAVKRAQVALKNSGHSLSADGIAGEQTLALLFDDAVMASFLTFGKGAKGQRVYALQTRLHDLKFLDSFPDGQFGAGTEKALTAFQAALKEGRAEDVLPTGKADPQTLEYLYQKALRPFGIAAPETWQEGDALSPRHLNAAYVCLMDAETGKVLFSSRMDERAYPASTTKIMTLLIALDQLPLNKEITIPASAGETPKGSSLVPVYPGEKMMVEDLLFGLMLRSGNDAANAVAELAAGSGTRFAGMMNEQARALSLADTHFENAHGYHHKLHYTTAHDLALLCREAIKSEPFMRIACALHHTMAATKKRAALDIHNTAEIVSKESPHYYEGALGIKSGYTHAAGNCYAGLASKDGHTLIAVVMRCRTRSQLWPDMTKLFNEGFRILSEKSKTP